jgi:ATP-dependent Lon protease
VTATAGDSSGPVPLPLISLRDLVVFPYMVTTILVGRPRSIAALDAAVETDGTLFLVGQRDPEEVEPGAGGLHAVGCIARVAQSLRLPDGTMKVLVEGLHRARLVSIVATEESPRAFVDPVPPPSAQDVEAEAIRRLVLASLKEYAALSRKLADEVVEAIERIGDPYQFACATAANLQLPLDTKQRMLETEGVEDLLRSLAGTLDAELEILRLEKRIEGEVRDRVHHSQREYYLQEQLRAIQRELGHAEDESEELGDLKESIRKARLPKRAREKASLELERLARVPPLTPEAGVIRNYLDWLLALPWKKKTRDNLDLGAVQQVLENDHYGLDKIKERVLEYLSVIKLAGRIKGPVLCFVGPPGVGKTSLGRSIARALGRKFVRVSLGGIRDEAEIRGHRRTYIGSLPGRILQSMRKAGTRNPVFLLDEIDKMGVDFRGDPSAALLEALDSEQNDSFSDHYLEVEFDLSDVMFITTANIEHTILPALRDRLEVIRLPGYLFHEKTEIARGYLVPKQLKAHGLDGSNVTLSPGSLARIVREYTREAGVRELERNIAAICRKVARQVASGEHRGTARVTARTVDSFLGPPLYKEQGVGRRSEVGLATGLSWTPVGGEVLTVEVAVVPGKGELSLTGKLGDVMRESAQAALSYARSRARRWGLKPDFHRDADIHVHLPEGAIPKDGPSAGITIASALLSALTGRPIPRSLAMTGEITLRGKVLPVGGLAEKIVAAQRSGVTDVVLPRSNRADLEEIAAQAKKGLTFHLVDTMDQVLKVALAPRSSSKARTASVCSGAAGAGIAT